MRRTGILVLGLAAVLGCARRSAWRAPRVDVLVLAPHPDDETLFAAGVIAEARDRHRRVAIVFVTNGDATCARNGWTRQGEAMRAARALGVGESDVHFLGYPDGQLARLGASPLPPVARAGADGTCGVGGETYANRGEGRVEEHRRRTGRHAPFTADALEGDLVALFARLRPRDVFLPHPLDEHPDHAATYAYARRALARLEFAPTLHRAVVHVGACWPEGGEGARCDGRTWAPDAPLPALPPPFADYRADDRRAVPLAFRLADPRENAKLRAIAMHASQLEAAPMHDWLASFVRADEAFWTERPDRRDAPSDAGQVGAPSAPMVTIDADERATSIDVLHEGRIELRFRVTLAPTAARASVDWLDGGGGPRTLRFDGDALELLVGSPAVRLHRWPLPVEAGEHTFVVRVEPRPREGVAEIEIRRDGALLGVGIDPFSPARGTRIVMRHDLRSRLELDALRALGAPGADRAGLP